MTIRPLEEKDWPAVRKIYKDGMDTGLATFETEVPDWKSWDAKFLQECRFVAEDDNAVVGWAVLSPTSKRYVYRGVAEVSIYVDLDHSGKGIGSALMEALIKSSEQEKFWTLQAIIFSNNQVSIRLHEKHGFRRIGIREKIAQRDGVWTDTVLLERRSQVVF